MLEERVDCNFLICLGYHCTLQQYVATDRVEKKLSAEDLIRATKPITIATAKAVAAGNSGKQEDVIVAANMGRKAVHDLLLTAKVSVPC